MCQVTSQISRKHVFAESSLQFRTAVPALSGMVLTKVPWLISLRFVGGIGAIELAAAALATTICNVTGLSFSVGLSSAMTTLTGQARGDLLARKAQKVNEERTALIESGPESDESGEWEQLPSADSGELLGPLVVLYQGLLLQMLLVVPVGIWWIKGSESALLWLGQGTELSHLTDEYLRLLSVALWSYSVNWTVTAWLQAIEMADVPAYAAAVGLVLHVPFNYLFIYQLGLGYLGCAVATVVFNLIQPALILTYLFGTEHGQRRVLDSLAADVLGRSRLSFWPEVCVALTNYSGIKEYVSLALPGVVMISEWWASETSIFLSGHLTPYPDLALGSFTLYQSLNSFCFMFPVSFSIAGSARVSSLLGAGRPREAQFAATVSVFLAGCVSALLGTILYTVPHTFFPSLFAPDEDDLIVQTSKTIPFLAWYVFGDGVQTAFNGIVKGTGQQFIGMPIVVVAYWVIGVPLGYYLAFVRGRGSMLCQDAFCGVTGLVTGLTVGTWVHMILLVVVVVGVTRWDVQARKAAERVGRVFRR